MIDIKCSYTELVLLSKLKPNPKNPNKHPEKQIKLYARIIEAQGWRRPITVSTRSGMIVRGHGAYEAAKLLRVKKVPVDYQDYKTEAEETEDLVADNRLSELSEIDKGLLQKLLETPDIDIDLTGYDDKLLKKMVQRNEIEEIRKALETEPEYKDTRDTAKELIESLTAKIKTVAEKEPERLNHALALVIQKGKGTGFLLLADPNTSDLVAELKRYALAGEHSPLEALTENNL
ncbi:ParB N-terminal domain-containing protein [bacterium]|nr:ParB N-terminal domain-containing protein [bacterium]